MCPTARRGVRCSTWFGSQYLGGSGQSLPQPRAQASASLYRVRGPCRWGKPCCQAAVFLSAVAHRRGTLLLVYSATHTHLAHSRLPQTSPVQEAGDVYVAGIGGLTSSPSIRLPDPFHECETCGRATSLAECPQCNMAFCHACLARGHRCMCGSPRQTHTSQFASLFAGFIALYIHLSCLAARLAQVHSESPQTPLAQKPMSLSILT